MASLVRPSTAELDGRCFDFLVIGAGITGAGVAQDAASRGYSTLLIDKGDFASGTSSKSSKLIHGGLRYLANMQFAVTIESLAERRVQQRIAPHLVWPMRFLIPTYRGNWFNKLKLRCGLILYDLLAGRGNKLRHKSISAAEIGQSCPGIKRSGLSGGFMYYDCRTDDARHTLEVIRSAVDCGATAANYVSLQSSIKDQNGKIVAAFLKDELSGRGFRVRARQIVNATGVWAGLTAKAAASKFDGEVLSSKGVHICVDRKRFPVEAAVVIPSVYDSRYMFAVPWYDRVVIGTTDSAYKGEIEKPRVEIDEQRYMLDAVNQMFPNLKLSDKDIVGRYAGLRPLLKTKGVDSTADLSRQHNLQVSPEGMISIAGGKLTTYRLMAKETVDFAQSLMNAGKSSVGQNRCRTDEMTLGGFSSADEPAVILEQVRREALSLGLRNETAEYLPKLYGKRCNELFEIIREEPKHAELLVEGHPYIMAQIVYALRYEAAQSVQDVLCRRIRLAILDTKTALELMEKVYSVMAPYLDWQAAEKSSRLMACRAEME